MHTPQDYKTGKRKRYIKIMNIGPSGSGKTHFSASFPKCYFLISEPGGEDTFLSKPELLRNIVGWDIFIPTSPQDTKRVFQELDTACNQAHRMAGNGEIETLVFDNMTYTSENRWIYINEYDRQMSTKTGELNTRAMYGDLGRWLYAFTLMKLISCPCNVIINCHEMLESDEAMGKKPKGSSPVVPNILGGFRDKSDGLVSCVLYLSKLDKPGGKYEYWARTNKGVGKNAKNRVNLPPTIQNISYNVIREAIEKGFSMENTKQV